jgi:hypothetical protein
MPAIATLIGGRLIVTFTPAIGTPADPESLGIEHVETWKKATGSSTAITLGHVVRRVDATSECAAVTTGMYGQFGVVARLFPNYDATTGAGDNNTDASAKVVVICHDGARVYVTCSGSIPIGSRVVAITTGLVGAYTEATWVSSTPNDFQLPLREFEKIVGVYEGHYGESEQNGTGTDATTGQTVRIRLGAF